MGSRRSRALMVLCGCLLACTGGAPNAGAPTTPAAAASGEPSAPAAAAPTEASADAPLVAIPGAARAVPGVLSGGQPTPEQLAEAAQRGYRTVISLRTSGEAGSEGEREQVEALGMRFLSIPIAGPADFTEAKARALSKALSAEGGKPAIVHCGSGNRVGALLSLEAFYVGGKSVEEAVELGKRAGLDTSEAAVREQLQSAATTQ